MYEVVKPLAAHQELIVYYLPERPERPEELFFVRMRSTLYRRTMDSILEGMYFYYLFSCFFFLIYCELCGFVKMLMDCVLLCVHWFTVIDTFDRGYIL